jgi:hypothetical protein
MMGYERLTERRETPLTMSMWGGSSRDLRVYNRLAELEDKIEQGTLIDTEAYFIVEENQWAGKDRFLVCQNAVQLAVCDFCETREEAEKRLKEVQNEN